MGKKLTIQDIARLAGVSKATVSRVLNQRQNVDPATRERVLRIMNEQNFVPSITASGLAGGRNRLLGVLIPSLTWPLIPELMRSIGEVLWRTNYELILYSITHVQDEKDRSEVIDRIVDSNLAAGLVAIFPGHSVHHLAELHSPTFPVVLIDDQGVPPEKLPRISVNNRIGAHDATCHLIRLGHRRIAHIQGPPRYQVSHERYQGYLDALQEAGIEPDPALVLPGNFMPPSGRSSAQTFLELANPPTAIFAGSDFMAYGAIAAIQQQELRVPEDIAIVGFDDNPSSAHLEPPLTTVRQPFYEMGKQAVELLLSLINTPPPTQTSDSEISQQIAASNDASYDPIHITLPTTLIIRQTCGALQRQMEPG